MAKSKPATEVPEHVFKLLIAWSLINYGKEKNAQPGTRLGIALLWSANECPTGYPVGQFSPWSAVPPLAA